MDVKLDIAGEMAGEMDAPTVNQENKPFSFGSLSNISSKIPGSWELLQKVRQQLRPWTEFLNTSNYKTVASLPRLSNRILRNLQYFQSNYLCIFLILMLYCLITTPLILLVLCGVLYACYRIREAKISLSIFGRQLNTYQQCLLVNCASAPIFYLVGATSVMFWVLGASLSVITLHASFYNIEAIVTEDTEGFLTEVI